MQMTIDEFYHMGEICGWHYWEDNFEHGDDILRDYTLNFKGEWRYYKANAEKEEVTFRQALKAFTEGYRKGMS